MTNKIEDSIPKMMLIGTFSLIFGFVILGGNFAEFLNESASYAGEDKKMSAKTIEEVLKGHTNDLMAIPGVVGTAQGLCNGKPCIKVFVIKKTPELEAKIPGELEGYTVKIEETGEFRALPESQR